MQDSKKSEVSTLEKKNEYKFGSLVFNIKREYCGKKQIADIISDMVIRKEISCN